MSGLPLRAQRRSSIAKSFPRSTAAFGRGRATARKTPLVRAAIRPSLEVTTVLAPAMQLDTAVDAPAGGIVLVESGLAGELRFRPRAPLLVPTLDGLPSQSIICAAPNALQAWILASTNGAKSALDDGPSTGAVVLPPVTPVWNPAARRLSFRGLLVKKLRTDASSQEMVLAAFERAGWAKWIADPFPLDDNVDRHDRLYNTVKRLNAQRHALIEFYCDGDGTGICWKPR